MQWKDVLSESVLETEGKIKARKAKSHQKGLPAACHEGRRRKAGSYGTDNACQAQRRAAPVHCAPAPASTAASVAVGAVITTGGSCGKPIGERAV